MITGTYRLYQPFHAIWPFRAYIILWLRAC